MANIRTANKRHNRAIVSAHARRRLAVAAVAKPEQAAKPAS